MEVKPLRKPPLLPLLLAAASDPPGKENHDEEDEEDEEDGAAIDGAAATGAGAMGSNEDPLNWKTGSFAPVSLRILIVSPTGVGWTLKLTEVSSSVTNSTPSEALAWPTDPVAAGGVPESFR